METEKRIFYESLSYPFLFVALLWAVRTIEYFFDFNFAVYGILPRTFQGLTGIFVSPLIHGDWNHLYSNSLPLVILGIIVFYFYRKIAFEIFFWVYFLTGVWVWVSADNKGYHIGSSGLIYGFVSFLFFSGIFRKDQKSLALALLVVFIYGSLVWGLFPLVSGVSWESHFFGALSGGFGAYYYRNIDPPKKYQWQEEEEIGGVDGEENMSGGREE